MFIGARIVAAIGVLDLDDFGPEIGQGLRAGRTGDNPGEIHDQQTVKGGRHTRVSGRALR
jgi:hypothetical protein